MKEKIKMGGVIIQGEKYIEKNDMLLCFYKMKDCQINESKKEILQELIDIFEKEL